MVDVEIKLERFSLAAVLFDVSDWGRSPRRRLALDHRRQGGFGAGRLPPDDKSAVRSPALCHVHKASARVLLVGREDHVAFGLAVVADALHAVDFGQLVDHLAVFSVHGGKAVALLWRLSL